MPARSAPSFPLHVLLVEDDPEHRSTIERAVHDRSPNARIHAVADGIDAWDYLRGDPARHDASPAVHLIILDLNLPGMHGHDLLDRLKNDDELSIVPVVVLTASRRQADRLRAYAAHVNSYLIKPRDEQSLYDLVSDAQRYWSGWNWPPQLV